MTCHVNPWSVRFRHLDPVLVHIVQTFTETSPGETEALLIVHDHLLEAASECVFDAGGAVSNDFKRLAALVSARVNINSRRLYHAR